MLDSRSMQILRKILRGHFYHSGPVTNRVSCAYYKKNEEKKGGNQNILFTVRNHENKFIFRTEEQLILHILRNVIYFAMQEDELGWRSTVSSIFRWRETWNI